MLRATPCLAIVLLAAPLLVSADDERPPEAAVDLSEIVQQVEQREEFSAFTEIEFEDGVWEVEYYDKEGEERELEIDPVTGEED